MALRELGSTGISQCVCAERVIMTYGIFHDIYHDIFHASAYLQEIQHPLLPELCCIKTGPKDMPMFWSEQILNVSCSWVHSSMRAEPDG